MHVQPDAVALRRTESVPSSSAAILNWGRHVDGTIPVTLKPIRMFSFEKAVFHGSQIMYMTSSFRSPSPHGLPSGRGVAYQPFLSILAASACPLDPRMSRLRWLKIEVSSPCAAGIRP